MERSLTFKDIIEEFMIQNGLRSPHKLYQKYNLNKIGISKSMLYSWLNNESVPRADTIKKIFACLKIDFNDSEIYSLVKNGRAERELLREKDRVIKKSFNFTSKSINDRRKYKAIIEPLIEAKLKKNNENFSEYISRLILNDLNIKD